jgi:hypothetical protein
LDAGAADKRGDYERGDKRFAGIVKATKKQFANDLKKHGQQGVAESDLEEIDRRGFLKGMGAAAVAGGAGYMGGVRRVQNTKLAQVLGKLNGFLKSLKASKVKDKWSYELITRTQDLIQKYKIDPDIFSYSEYSFGENQGERAYSMAFRNGIQTEQDREKYEAMLFELSADLMNATSFHPKYSGARIFDSVEQGVAEGSSTASDAVERAILNRIMVQHTDLLMRFGPDKVMQAAEEVAYNVGDVDEIGTSDVSAYVNQVKQILGA